MRKIVAVGIDNKTIPIQWNKNVTNVEWHNAAVMATIMSRRLDAAKLWDGTIMMVQEIPTFVLEDKNVYLNDIYIRPLGKTQIPVPASFGVNIGGFVLNPPKATFEGVTENLNAELLTHYRENFTELLAPFTLQPTKAELSEINDTITIETV